MNLKQDLDALGGLGVLIDNAAFVRVDRLEAIPGAEIKTIVAIELRGPILPICAVPIVAAFYTTYAAAKANAARFGEALRRERKSEGVHVLTAHPCGTGAPMTKSDRAGSELGFSRQTESAVAEGIVAGVETYAWEAVRSGETRDKMIALNSETGSGGGTICRPAAGAARSREGSFAAPVKARPVPAAK